MVDINHKEREIRAKIIYYGPAAGGKTTNLLELSRRADPKRRGQMLSIDTTQERTLLLDLVGVKAPSFRNYDMRIQVIAVPGQRMYAASRKFLITGADAVVFVANSAADRWEDTLESMKELNEYLMAQGIDPTSIPVVFQYNKQDLPEVTPMEAMERTLNARKSDSFPAVAVRCEGVFETFAAVLARTVHHLIEHYELGDPAKDGPAVEAWTEKTMQMVFNPEKAAERAEEAEQAEEAEEAKEAEKPEEASAEESEEVEAGEEKEGSTASPDASVLDASPDDLWRKSVKVASAGNLPATSATETSESTSTTQADATTDNLVESYVEAAAQLSDLLEVSHENQKATQNRLEELSAPIDAARLLLSGEPAEQVLEQVLEQIGKGLGTAVSSLSLVRPDGELSTVVLRNLEVEPLFALVSKDGSSIPASIMGKEEPVIHASGESGPLQGALDRLGETATALVAIPVRTPVRALGLACFYLPQESAAPGESAVPHLVRIGQGLALALEIASVDIAAERLQRMEKAALVGHLTERVISEIGLPIDQLLTSVGNTIAQIPRGSGTSPQLLNELLTVSKDLVKTQELRESVLGFLSGKLPDEGAASVEELFEQLRSEYAEPLERTGILLEVDLEPGAEVVSADAFLLRGALLALIEHLRNYLAGCEGGQIRISAEPVHGDRIRICVSDNTGVVRTSGGASALPDYLAWSLDRRVTGFGLTLAQLVVQHYGGEWQMSVAAERGNEIALTIPSGVPSPSEQQPTPQHTN